MHADDFRTNRHNVVSDLQDGGYSDDMTLAAIAGDICHVSESYINSVWLQETYCIFVYIPNICPVD